MKTSLQSLFQAISQAQAELELRQPVMAQVGEYFTATRWGLSFLDEFPSHSLMPTLLASSALPCRLTTIQSYGI
jgi:hypothetical protein